MRHDRASGPDGARLHIIGIVGIRPLPCIRIIIIAHSPINRIVRYGDLVSELLLVIRGSVEVSAGVTRGRCSILRSDWRGPGSVICEAAALMPSRSGVEIRADFAEVRSHGHHMVITWSSHGHHAVIT